MSYDTAITGLKTLMRRDLIHIPVSDHVEQLGSESDRAAIILHAAMVERFLVGALQEKMSNLNNEERERIFSFEGPLGSFSNRIRLAHAFDIISRPLRRKLDLLREMRNVAAHAHPNISFETKEIREAFLTMLDPDDRKLLKPLDAKRYRKAFSLYCTILNTILTPTQHGKIGERQKIFSDGLRRQHDAQLPSPGKSGKRSQPNRPASVRKVLRPSRPPKPSND